MDLSTLTRRVVSAAVAGAMALSLCAPALAATLPSLPGTPVKELEVIDTDVNFNGYGIIVNNVLVKEDNKDDILVGKVYGGTLTYDPATNTLSSSGRVDGDLTIVGGDAAVNVDLQNPNNEYNTTAVNGSLTVTGAHNVSVAAAGDWGSAYAAKGNVNITCTGDVKITGAVTGNNAVAGNFTVYAANSVTLEGAGPLVGDDGMERDSVVAGDVNITCSGDVKLTGYSGNYFIAGSAIITSPGSVHIENTNSEHGLINRGLTYTNYTGGEKVLRCDDAFTQAVAANGTYSGDNWYASKITIGPEAKYTVITNGCTLQDTTVNAFYAGQTVRVAATPAEGKQFERWNAVWTNSIGTDQPLPIGEDGSFTMPAGKVRITAKYGSTPAPGPALSAYTLDISGLTSQVKIEVDANGKHTVKIGEQVLAEECDSVIITGTNTDAGFSVEVTVTNGQSADITLDGVTIETNSEAALSLLGAANVTLKNDNTLKGGTYGISAGALNITGSGTLEAEGEERGIYGNSNVTISAAVTAKGTKVAEHMYDGYGIYSADVLTIKNGKVKATGVEAALCGVNGIVVTDSTVDAAGTYRGFISSEGKVSVTDNSTVTATGEWHGIYGGNGVEIKDSGVRASSINSGNAIKEISGTSKVFLTSQTPSGWTTGGLNTDDSTGWLLWKDDTAEGGVGGVPEGKTAPSLDALLNGDPSAYKKLTAPGEPSGDEDIPGDAAGDAGGAIAAVAVGGAAIVGGYEIATRVILSQLLPEGASIPKNQGELALLVWNRAGKPEPAAAAPYADDTAKALQWCVEQGCLDSTDAGKWTPKFRVIEVWNKAFPRQ